MPNIGAYHPVIVHFVIVLLILGVIFRWISLTGRAPFTAPAATTLLLLGALAALLAVHSGRDAPLSRRPLSSGAAGPRPTRQRARRGVIRAARAAVPQRHHRAIAGDRIAGPRSSRLPHGVGGARAVFDPRG